MWCLMSRRSDSLVLLQLQQEESSSHLQPTLQPVRVAILGTQEEQFLHLLSRLNSGGREEKNRMERFQTTQIPEANETDLHIQNAAEGTCGGKQRGRK